MRKGEKGIKQGRNSEPKNAAPTKPQKVSGPSAKQRRHERRMEAAFAARATGKRGGHMAQVKIDAKRATRRRMSSYTPKVRAEHSSAGREHRKPRS